MVSWRRPSDPLVPRVTGGSRSVVFTEADARFGRQGGVFQVESLQGALDVEEEEDGLLNVGQQAVLTDRFARIGNVPTFCCSRSSGRARAYPAATYESVWGPRPVLE